MNRSTERVLDIVYGDDSLFLSAIDADSPSELKRIILKFINSGDYGRFDIGDVEWKKVYRELKDINDPISMR